MHTLRPQKKTPPYGGVAYDKLPTPRPALDSSPTPVFELGYRDLNAKFLLLASRFDSHSLILSKNLEKLDIEGSKECKRIADNIIEVAKRIEQWPSMELSNAGLSAEKSWAAEQFIIFMDLFESLIGERAIIR